jgi:hypothetical protein
MSFPRTENHRAGSPFRLPLVLEKDRVRRTVADLAITATGQNAGFTTTFTVEKRDDLGGFDIVQNSTDHWPKGDLFCTVTLSGVPSEYFVVPVI